MFAGLLRKYTSTRLKKMDEELPLESCGFDALAVAFLSACHSSTRLTTHMFNDRPRFTPPCHPIGYVCSRSRRPLPVTQPGNIRMLRCQRFSTYRLSDENLTQWPSKVTPRTTASDIKGLDVTQGNSTRHSVPVRLKDSGPLHGNAHQNARGSECRAVCMTLVSASGRDGDASSLALSSSGTPCSQCRFPRKESFVCFSFRSWPLTTEQLVSKNAPFLADGERVGRLGSAFH